MQSRRLSPQLCVKLRMIGVIVPLMIRIFAFLVLAAAGTVLSLPAQEKIDVEMNRRIRQELSANSRIMHTIHRLTDVYGPRLTGSPGFEAACRWALGQLKEWGLHAELEEWDFGRFGWVNEKTSVAVTSPFRGRLEASAIAWTPSTSGTIKANAVLIIPPSRPTRESLDAYLHSVGEKVRGKIVLAGAPAVVPVRFVSPAKRRDDSELLAEYDSDQKGRQKEREDASPDMLPRLQPYEIDQTIDAFLLAQGARVKITDSAREHGQLRASTNYTYNASTALPGIVIRNEDYGRLCRLLAGGMDVEMEIDILNNIHPEGRKSFNVVAEIPGTDMKEQVVMIGAHIDSWHTGTGATDNAAGVAVMMEAGRVLQRLGTRPRRTIRIALWGGEEQGLLGSKAYVRDHFGTFESPGRELSNLSAYINLDSGTGRVRGGSVFGPPEAASVVREILFPFQDLGVAGVNSIRNRSLGGTDHSSFNRAGLPGINLLQDPIEYRTHTWHTELDTFERILEEDLRQCTIVIASLVYHLAMRQEMLPRFTRSEMPLPD